MSPQAYITNPYSKANIFNAKDFELILKKINALSDSSKRQWGTMSLPEMLKHCSLQLKMALSEIQGSKHEGSFVLRSGFGRWMGLYGPCWQKGAITPSQMNIEKQNISTCSFIIERKQFISYLKLVQTKDNFQAHPIFGKLNEKDWGRLIWKHLDHHLRQFGA